MHLLARFLTRILVQVGLAVLIGTAVLSFAVTDERTLLDSLSESGFYSEFVDVAIDEAQNESTQNPSGGNALPIDDPEVRAIIEKSITPSTLQSTTETVTGAVYSWLDGTTSDLMFEVDLTSTRDDLTRNLTTYATDKFEDLPVCSDGESFGDESVLTSQCRPAGFSAQQVSDEVRANVQNSDLLEGWMINQDTLADENGETITDSLSGVKDVYQGAEQSFTIASIGFGVIVVLYLLARRPFVNGLHKLGRTLLTSGILGVVSIGALYFLLPRILTGSIDAGGAVGTLAVAIVEAFAGKMMLAALAATVVTTVIGLVVMSVFRLRKPLHNSNL